MTQVTRNPISTATAGGATVEPPAMNPHGALGDDLDTTYVELAGTHTGLGFNGPTLPSGALIKQIAVSARVASKPPPGGDVGAAWTSLLRSNLPAIPGKQDTTVSWQVQRTQFTYTADSPGVPSSWEVDLSNQTNPSGGGGGATTPLLRVYKLQLLITYVTKPVVAVDNPSGTITNSSFPLTTWSVSSDTDGGALDQAEVKIFSAAQYGAAGFSPGGSAPTAGSGVLSQAAANMDVPRNWRPTTKLANATYRSYVRTKQHPYSNWSDWAFSQFTVNVVPPANPTVTVTAQNPEGRIKVDVQGNDSPRTVDAAEIQWSPGGGVWFPIRSFSQTDDYVGVVPINGRVVAYHWEAPIDFPITYRVRVLHSYALGEWATSDWVTSPSVTWTSTDWWVKHPTQWDLNQAVKVRSQASFTRTQRQGTFTPLGRDDPVVITDKRTRAAGEITFRFLDDASQDAMDAIMNTDSALLIQAPSGHNWTDSWVRLGDQTRERVVDQMARPWVFDTFPWQAVRLPAGTIVSYPGTGPGGPTHLTLPFTLGGGINLH